MRMLRPVSRHEGRAEMNVALIVSTLAAVGGGLAMLWLSRALNRRGRSRN